jgi:hypothetical protein
VFYLKVAVSSVGNIDREVVEKGLVDTLNKLQVSKEDCNCFNGGSVRAEVLSENDIAYLYEEAKKQKDAMIDKNN